MARRGSVVTPERFAQGLTYEEYIRQIQVNRDQFQHFYETFQLRPEDEAFFREATRHPRGPAKVLALAEDWCPDVYRGLPVMARIAEAAGMELRIFPRDQNLDIMDEFLYQGRFRSIPTFVFYTRDMEYICHWIERPALANRERERVEAEVVAAMPDAPLQEQRAEIRRRTLARYPVWQQEQAREIRELLASHLS